MSASKVWAWLSTPVTLSWFPCAVKGRLQDVSSQIYSNTAFLSQHPAYSYFEITLLWFGFISLCRVCWDLIISFVVVADAGWSLAGFTGAILLWRRDRKIMEFIPLCGEFWPTACSSYKTSSSFLFVEYTLTNRMLQLQDLVDQRAFPPYTFPSCGFKLPVW